MLKAKDVMSLNEKISNSIQSGIDRADEQHQKMIEEQFENPKKIFEKLMWDIIEKGESVSEEHLEQCFFSAVHKLDGIYSAGRLWELEYYEILDQYAKAVGIEEKISSSSDIIKKA
jgi:hypothetical protein